MLLRDRVDAGKQLAARLVHLKSEPNLVVLGIPRGGIVVATEIARALAAPLDVFLAHKIGAPTNPEFAIGAVTDPGEHWLDYATIAELRIDSAEVSEAVERGRIELARRAALYRGARAAIDVTGKLVIVVDDGIATGATMFSAVRALRTGSPAHLIVAIPVGPGDAIDALRAECEDVVALAAPEPFIAVSRCYLEFSQTEDGEVIRLLREALRRVGNEKKGVGQMG